MCISLKRCFAMLATVFLLFSVSLVPCYAEATDTGSPLYLYINYPTCPSPLLNSVAYPVPWNKFEIGHNFSNFDPSPSSYSDTALGVESSVFKALTTSGSQPTIYYAYSAVSANDVTAPGYASSVASSVSGTAYNINGGSLGSITQTRVSQIGPDAKQKICVVRTTLPHNTTRFVFPVTTGSPAFRLYKGTNTIGFAFAYVVNTDDSAILSKIDEIITILNNMDTDLDTVVELLGSVVNYLNTLVHTTDDIAQNVNGIYDLLKNALAAESAELSQNAQHVGDTVMQQADGEQYWNDKNTDNFKALDLSNYSFESALITALAAVGKWFTNIWDSLGPTTIIFTFPLVLGVSLVVVGRVARSSGKGSKTDKGGDSDG